MQKVYFCPGIGFCLSGKIVKFTSYKSQYQGFVDMDIVKYRYNKIKYSQYQNDILTYLSLNVLFLKMAGFYSKNVREEGSQHCMYEVA